MVWTWEMEGVLKPYDDVDFLKDLKRQLRLHGTLKQHAIGLGLHERFFYKVLARKIRLPVDIYLKLVQTYDLCLPASFKTLEQRTFDKPVEILLAQREQKELASNAFLGRLSSRIFRLLACEIDGAAKGRSVRAILAELEELRFGDRLAAQKGAEKLAHSILHDLEETKGPKPAGELGELAATLALWATIQRSRGFRDLALNAFTMAFPLARRSGDHWSLGSWYQRAAYLLRDLDRPDLGFDFLGEALNHYSAGQSQIDTWKCLMDRGLMLGSQGKFVESNNVYEISLQRLPGSEWRFRVGAYQGLSVNSQLQGNFEAARSHLASAIGECRKQDLVLAHLKWISARIEAELGHHERSTRLFQEALEQLSHFGSAADVALVCLDQAELFLKLQQYPALVQLVAGVAKWLPKLYANPMLCRAFERFVDLARVARIGLADLENTKAEIREAWKLGEQTLPS
jgi:tetratricopeptide (TPR) repeat protein